MLNGNLVVSNIVLNLSSNTTSVSDLKLFLGSLKSASIISSCECLGVFEIQSSVKDSRLIRSWQQKHSLI